MSKRAEEAALKAYSVQIIEHNKVNGGTLKIDVNTNPRYFYQQGYEQAEKDFTEIQGEDTKLRDAAAALVEAVEQYVEPKPGTPYMHRNKLLGIKNNLKKLING